MLQDLSYKIECLQNLPSKNKREYMCIIITLQDELFIKDNTTNREVVEQ